MRLSNKINRSKAYFLFPRSTGILSLLIPLVLIGFSAKVFSIDLQTAYQLALKNDPQLKVAKQTLNGNLELKNIARSQLLPKINTNATYRDGRKQSVGNFPITLDQDQNPLTAEIRALRAVDNESDEINSSWGFTLSQPLFDLSAWFTFRKGSFENNLAKLEYEAELVELHRRVSLSYLDAIEAQQNLELSYALEESEQELLTQVKRMKEAGINTSIDVYQAMAALDASTAQVLDDSDTLNERLENLGIMTGRDHESVWKLGQLVPTTVMDNLNEVLEAVKSNNLQLKISKQQINMARAAASSAKLEHAPKLTLDLQYSKYEIKTDEIDNSLPFEFESDVDDAALTITASLPLYSGGLVSAKRRQTYHELLTSQERHHANMLDITRQAKIAYKKVVSGQKRLNTYSKAFQSNKKALDGVKRGFEVGDRSLNDVLIAQKNFFSIQKRFEQSQLAYLKSIVELKALSGTLSPDDIIQLNSLLSIR